MDHRLSPSILAADFMQLASAIADLKASGCSMLHMDVMDGAFVPQITFGEKMIKDVRSIFPGVIDAHLMIDQPERQIPRLAESGADIIIPHLENSDPAAVIDLIEAHGKKAGLAIDGPTEDLTGLEGVLSRLEVVLVATGKVGKAGQRLDEYCLSKVSRIRALKGGDEVNIMVDIGINRDTIERAKQAGANWFVASSAIFCHPNGMTAGYKELLDLINN